MSSPGTRCLAKTHERSWRPPKTLEVQFANSFAGLLFSFQRPIDPAYWQSQYSTQRAQTVKHFLPRAAVFFVDAARSRTAAGLRDGRSITLSDLPCQG